MGIWRLSKVLKLDEIGKESPNPHIASRGEASKECEECLMVQEENGRSLSSLVSCSVTAIKCHTFGGQINSFFSLIKFILMQAYSVFYLLSLLTLSYLPSMTTSP